MRDPLSLVELVGSDGVEEDDTYGVGREENTQVLLLPEFDGKKIQRTQDEIREIMTEVLNSSVAPPEKIVQMIALLVETSDTTLKKLIIETVRSSLEVTLVDHKLENEKQKMKRIHQLKN